jgi:exonuclease VII small subunit
MPRRRDVSPEDLSRIIQLRQSRTSWLKIQKTTGVPRQIAKREYQAWEQNQSKKELKQARIQVATNLFSEHLEHIVRLAEALVNHMPESMTPLEGRDAETVVNDILTMCIASETEESVSIIPLQQETEKAQRRIFRQNAVLFRSLRDHTREKVDWQVLEKWKTGWNTSMKAMKALHPKAEKRVRNILDHQKQSVRDKIEATEGGDSILSNMVAGIVEVVWRGVNDNTLERVAELVQTKQITGGRGLIVFSESGSVTRIELRDSGLAEDVAGICAWVANNLSIEERDGQIRLYKDGIEAMKEAMKKLEDMLDPLMLRPMILRTTCDLCPA